MLKNKRMTPRLIRGRLSRLLTELCKFSANREEGCLNIDGYLDIKEFLGKNHWAKKIYGFQRGFNIHQAEDMHRFVKVATFSIEYDLKRLQEMGHLEIDKDFSNSGTVRVPTKCLLEAGKSWFLRMWEKQPATTGSVIVSAVSLVLSVAALFISLHKSVTN